MTAPTVSYTPPAFAAWRLTRCRSTGALTTSVLGPGTCTISGTPTTANASAQTATVTITDSAGNVSTETIAFPAVAKADQTLAGFAYSASEITYGDEAPAVTTPSGAQTPVTYSASPSTVCGVDSVTGALTIAGAGTCTIMATAAGNAHYKEASVTFDLVVQPAGTLVLHVDAIADDNTINAQEKAAALASAGSGGSTG